MRTATQGTEAVFDASCILRAILRREPTAVEWVRRAAARRVSAWVPELIFVEIANVLLRQVRAGRLTSDQAANRVSFAVGLPLKVESMRRLSQLALGSALARDLTAYDASYLVLAELRDAVLVTADQRLASAYRRSVLVP